LIRDTPLNRAKLDELGAMLGARPREISPRTRALRIDAQPASLDVLFDELSGGLRFESLRPRAVVVPLGEKAALVARLEDVIASKEAANRPKDQAQLPILRDALRVKQALEGG
jgi:hypothetical protein